MAKAVLTLCLLLSACGDPDIACKQWDVQERAVITPRGGYFIVPVKVCRQWAVREGVNG